MKMLAARAKEAGMELDFDSTKELSNGEIDLKIKEIEAFAQVKREEKARDVPVVKSEFNKIRFGLACKLVVQEKGIKWCNESGLDFLNTAIKLYETFSNAEDVAQATPSPSPDDQDFRAEMAMERAQEDHQDLIDYLSEHASAIEKAELLRLREDPCFLA